MCFSATASFGSAAVLGSLGVGAIIKAKENRQIPFAAIPLIFGIQQCIEGFLWLAIRDSSSHVISLTYGFLFFALLWWPLYIPLMAYCMEDFLMRKRILMILGLIGLGVGSALYLIFLHNPAMAQIINRCVYYPLNLPNWGWFAGLYSVATLGPGIVSSKLPIRVFCALLFVFGLLAWIAYRVNFISVWCFFAALLSLVIFFYDSQFHKVKRLFVSNLI